MVVKGIFSKAVLDRNGRGNDQLIKIVGCGDFDRKIVWPKNSLAKLAWAKSGLVKKNSLVKK
jgi:hypothetical protein